MQHTGYRVFLPAQVEYAVSEEGRKFKTLKVLPNTNAEEEVMRKTILAKLPATKAL